MKKFINVTPSPWVKLEGFEGNEIKKEVTITSLEEKPLEIKDITCTAEDKIAYTLTTQKEGREYTLEIKNLLTQEGPFQGEIELKTNSERKPLITISVRGKIQARVLVTPETISFGAIDTTTEDFSARVFKKLFRIKDAQGEGFTLTEINASQEWITTETLERNKDYTIIVTLKKDKLPKGPFKEKIDIRLDYKREPLIVNVAGEVI